MEYDVFISHNGKDKSSATKLAEALKAKGLSVWFDIWNLIPGRPWQDEAELAIKISKTAVVLIGRDGIGPWENREMRACLSEFVERKMSVIPVLLESATTTPNLPLFLKDFTWVDFRNDKFENALDRLEWGIREPATRFADDDLVDDTSDYNQSYLYSYPKHIKRIIFDSSHNEYLNIESKHDYFHRRSDFDFSYLRQYLIELGYQVNRLTGRKRLLDVDIMGDILVLGQPESFYPHSALMVDRINNDLPEDDKVGFLDENEIQMILSFVEGGGGLLVCQEYNGEYYKNKKRNNLNKLTCHFGFKFNDDTVKIRDDENVDNAIAGQENLRIPKQYLVLHPIFNNVSAFLYLRGCSLNECSEENLDSVKWGQREIIACSYDGRGIIGICQYGSGRVVLTGDATGFSRSAMEPGKASYFENKVTDAAQQKIFTSNLFYWLSGY